jgi:2,3-bisphosphoglycerate-independent phosphoglycerate mutase
LEEFLYPKNIAFITVTQYKLNHLFKIAFKLQYIGNVLAETLRSQGINQVHAAETEKYAHVTFFFNGGVKMVFPLETWDEKQDLVPSNKSVLTYNKAPEMSAANVAKQVCKRASEGKFEFVMNNFATRGMVRHTDVYETAIIGVAATDNAIGEIYETCKKECHILFITSDYG